VVPVVFLMLLYIPVSCTFQMHNGLLQALLDSVHNAGLFTGVKLLPGLDTATTAVAIRVSLPRNVFLLSLSEAGFVYREAFTTCPEQHSAFSHRAVSESQFTD